MKKCLLIAPKFNGYYKDIINSLDKLGYETSFEKDQVDDTTFSFIKKKVCKKAIVKSTTKYVNHICQKYDNSFNIVIVILAYSFSKIDIVHLKNKFSMAKFIYYAWDSVDNFPIIKDLAHECDICFSFDDKDCKKYNFKFLPLFYVRKEAQTQTKEFDYSIIMSMYPTKIAYYEQIINSIPKHYNGVKYIVIKSRIFYLYFKIKYHDLFKKFKMKDFKYHALNRDEVYKIYSKSKVVFDIPLKNQNGLTIRTFEALALHCKIVTTNKNIENYSFYNSKNIFLYTQNKQIPESFFQKPYDMSSDISNEYYIDNFVRKLLNDL